MNYVPPDYRLLVAEHLTRLNEAEADRKQQSAVRAVTGAVASKKR